MKSQNNYWFLVRQFALNDFKLRYNNSILGYFWSLLNPLLHFGVLFLIFSVFLRFDVPYYSLYLLSGVVLWSFLVESTNNAMDSLLGKSSLIRKINFPKQIIVIASNINSIVGFAINFIVISAFFIVSKVKLSATLLFLPVYGLSLLLLAIGLSFFLSALYIRFRDIKHLWGVFLQLGFWLTPVIYPVSVIPEKFRLLFNLNPMYGIIHNFREIVIYGNTPEIYSTLFSLAFSLLIFFLGYLLFEHMSDKFAEYI